jgi:hypothetical protein
MPARMTFRTSMKAFELRCMAQVTNLMRGHAAVQRPQTLSRIMLGRSRTPLPPLNAILGTCRWCDPQHADRYLAAYEWRFNRRFDLAKNVQRLARVAVATVPAPYRIISPARRIAEMPG